MFGENEYYSVHTYRILTYKEQLKNTAAYSQTRGKMRYQRAKKEVRTGRRVEVREKSVEERHGGREERKERDHETVTQCLHLHK